MSRNSETSRYPSLAQHFDAPDDYSGYFGWLCGYSADAVFLDDATERFTRLTHSQRAQQGRIALAMFLDPGNPPIMLKDAPGVAHLPIIGLTNIPFRLLHAKVALLGFRHQENYGQWQLRLLVSTGNWTRQTLEESLDLMWRIDITSESLDQLGLDVKQDCVDIKAAWDLMTWIQQFFDTRLLNASAHGRLSETMNALQQVRRWIETCLESAQGRPRFFDNRSDSLLSQLPDKIKASGEGRRNRLSMGSGFYETSDDSQNPPEVPMAILKTLRDERLLTGKNVDLYVNPMACQAIATARKPLQELGISIRPAAIPITVFGEGAQRSLHAKFLFSAYKRDKSNACTNAWVYLGSGNLTHPGFANKMSAASGNLEAGVVFAPNSLCWQKSKANQDNLVVTSLLPIQWDEEVGDTTPLSAGSEMEQRAAVYVAPPVAWLTWHEVESVGELRTVEPSVDDVEILDSTGITCSRTATGFQWCDAQPRQVCMRWQSVNGQSHEALIPVVDQYGRIAAAELPLIDIEEAWWQLADFPMPPDEDGGDDGEGGSDEIENKDNQNGRLTPAASYPIRQMMNLIESIAAKQTEIAEMDWVLWCNRLEQTLGQARDSIPVTYFRDVLMLNPLSPLRHHYFRPSFADSSISYFGKIYDDTLDRIEKKWDINELNSIGSSK